MIEALALAIQDGMAWHVFQDGMLLKSFYFPGSASAYMQSQQRKNPSSKFQVKYLTNTLTQEQRA